MRKETIRVVLEGQDAISAMMAIERISERTARWFLQLPPKGGQNA